MHAAGFSFALGAFIAGLILSESEFSHQALSDVVPLRDIFGLLFFVTVGMLFDPAYAMENVGTILLVVAAIIVGKALIFGLIARAFGYRYMAPWVIGFGLSQIGEFSFVLARAGVSAGMVSKPVYDLILTATVLTMALSPVVTAAALPMGRAWKRWFGTADAPQPIEFASDQLTDHVIVGGYGRAGRTAARALREANIPCLVVEFSYPLIGDLRDDGFTGLWGDIAREEVLQAARVEHAKMLLLTIPDQITVDLAIARSRRLKPDLIVVARSARVPHVKELRDIGVLAVQPEFEGGLEMVRQGLLSCGRGEDEVGRIVGQLRQDIYQAGNQLL